MTTEALCRHFSRMGARLKIQVPGARQREKIRIDIGRDRDGEFFDLRCLAGIEPEVLQVVPPARHLLLIVRDGQAKNKFLLGHDERHWFVAAVPGDHVRDVPTAIASLRPLRQDAATRSGRVSGSSFRLLGPRLAPGKFTGRNGSVVEPVNLTSVRS